ncbi:MAG: hypothetical protein ACOC5T_04765 [Elusimicrobiota bacterium]
MEDILIDVLNEYGTVDMQRSSGSDIPKLESAAIKWSVEKGFKIHIHRYKF